ncbi:unnamed protein product [Rotaria sp. Silwood2]|nr:unnamed protein product [Rotaria sp. Silwood2]CAF3132061.1 unnamed protein product [Rotaria sp. Silwood2]CAF4177186.1 unnamed protein product [Rotaria sp. Silwood2]CAF4213247.1 unnamed protein product [Rotaria sp. Silwood2]CAF4484173.1 unnamed protein product [Rotaria sp. Silwood2]
MKRPSHWSRSKELLAQICSQTNQNDTLAPVEHTFNDDLSTICISILFLGSRQPFHLSHSNIKINEFYDIEQCIQWIQNNSSFHIYLIISMSDFQDIRYVVELNSVHAVYIVMDLESNELIEMLSTYSKLSGIFVLNEDLLDQIITDICFYRQIRFRLPDMNIFKLESNILGKLNERQVDFLCFQLFSGILSELPNQSTTTGDSNTQNEGHLLIHLIEANTKINYLFKDFNTSTLQNSVTTLKELNQRILSLAKTINSSSDTVYRAQIVSKTDLKMLQNNSNNLLAIQTFVLASRSFQSVVDICRRAVDNQLTVVLFELKLSNKISVAQLNSDTLVFSLGTLFRLVSTDPELNGVWRAQLEPVDGAMQRIINQLRIEIGGHLTWLTFGNYLTALKRYDAAKNYYEYLLLVLPSDHPSLAFIYDNMGLMYSEMSDNEMALTLFKKASELNVANLPMPAEQIKLSTMDLSCPESSSIDQMTIFNKIAEIKYREGNYQAAIDYYREALHVATDSASLQFYQNKIEKLLSIKDTVDSDN